MQKLLSSFHWLIKAPPPMRPLCKQNRPLQRLLTGCKVRAAAFVSVVSRLFALFAF